MKVQQIDNYRFCNIDKDIADEKKSSLINKISTKIFAFVDFTSQAPRDWKVSLISCTVFSGIMAAGFIFLTPVSIPLGIVAPPLVAHVAHRVTIIALNQFFEKLPEDEPQHQRPFSVGLAGSLGLLSVRYGMNALLSPVISPLLAFPISEIAATGVRLAASKAASICHNLMFGTKKYSPTLEEIGDFGFYLAKAGARECTHKMKSAFCDVLSVSKRSFLSLLYQVCLLKRSFSEGKISSKIPNSSFEYTP
jgi:hypothetical protein